MTKSKAQRSGILAIVAILAAEAVSLNELQARPPGTIKLPALKPSLTVRYFAQDGVGVVITTTPRIPMRCVGETNTVGMPGLMRCEGKSVTKTVTVQVERQGVPNTAAPVPVTGKQWLGACAGTAGATCTLDVTLPKEVLVDFNA